jgi:hypothetical protein
MGAITKGQSRSAYRTDCDRQRLDQSGRDKINISRERIDAIAGHDSMWRDASGVIDADQGQSVANVGPASQACFAHTAVHRRIDEDGLAHRQIAVRLGKVANELMPESRAGLSTNVFTVCDVQVAAANPGVRDVHRHPPGAGFGHGDRSDGYDSAAFPHQRVLFSHDLDPP